MIRIAIVKSETFKKGLKSQLYNLKNLHVLRKVKCRIENRLKVYIAPDSFQSNVQKA